MTILTDITGWREEKRSLENSELWNRTFVNNPKCGVENGARVGPRPPTPVSQLLDLLETMMRDPELNAALEAEYKWQRTPLEPGEQIDVDNDPRVPREQDHMLTEFKVWYYMKTGMCPHVSLFHVWVLAFHWRLKDEGITDVHSKQAKDLMPHHKDGRQACRRQ